jgi:hypothetical protein
MAALPMFPPGSRFSPTGHSAPRTCPKVMTGPVRLERPEPLRWPDRGSWYVLKGGSTDRVRGIVVPIASLQEVLLRWRRTVQGSGTAGHVTPKHFGSSGPSCGSGVEVEETGVGVVRSPLSAAYWSLP